MIDLDDLSRDELLTMLRGQLAPSPATIARVHADALSAEAARKRALWSEASQKAVRAAQHARALMAGPSCPAMHEAFALARRFDADAASDWIAYSRAKAKAETAQRYARRLAALEVW